MFGYSYVDITWDNFWFLVCKVEKSWWYYCDPQSEIIAWFDLNVYLNILRWFGFLV